MKGKHMKTIEVVGAVIVQNNEIYASQRGYGEFKDGWEFPGGKIEPGESPRQALKREIKEELDTDIDVGEAIGIVDYQYPNFRIHLHLYICSIAFGSPKMLEAEGEKWVSIDNLNSIDWLPADLEAIDRVKNYFNVKK